MTNNMKLFISINSKHKVFFGMRVNAEKKECKTLVELNNSAGVLYKFEGGKEMLLTPKDIQSAPQFIPKWDIR